MQPNPQYFKGNKFYVSLSNSKENAELVIDKSPKQVIGGIDNRDMLFLAIYG